jgi:hypothetical protein
MSERQPVDEQHDVRPPDALAFSHGELVDREPVVVVWFVEIEHARLRPGNGAVRATVLDRHTIDKHPVHRAVALQE